jgi:RNA recognition motif-containing protein
MNGIKTIIARNLPRDITVDTLQSVFDKYGPIKDIYIPRNMDKSSPYYGTIKGFALIKFLKSDDSTNAYINETSLTIGTNHITLEFAKNDR